MQRKLISYVNITIIITSLIAILGSSSEAEVVVGPVIEEELEKGDSSGSKELGLRRIMDEASTKFFSKLGIRILPKEGVNPSPEIARKRVQQMIEAGVTSETEVYESIRHSESVSISSLLVDLSRQRLYLLNPEGKILHEFPVSTGVRGYDTPPGKYKIVNKAPYAYSKKYGADMYQWMGITANGDYGLHSLKGSSYERLLGRRASHGCIRLSRKDAKLLYPLISIGTPVEIMNRVEKLVYFESVTDEDLRALVREAIQGTPPQTFF